MVEDSCEFIHRRYRVRGGKERRRLHNAVLLLALYRIVEKAPQIWQIEHRHSCHIRAVVLLFVS
jgi:hypothetical protein